MKHFVRMLLVTASGFMILGNCFHNFWMAVTASSLFFTANLTALIYNLPKKSHK